ncbi:Transforming growth factor-beta receptor-associated protein 1 [Madurella mycetomatis]|uniref:Transforming growth factor-beta receptor-associated protein 1 n=1 Tax=Madurella mycetomatis TaxID=100816 RepID=A0A175W6E4_9PEZI|nr:Transforming growth factor-beta receptor-associated protein 1 [Madurella mycetomatis]
MASDPQRKKHKAAGALPGAGPFGLRPLLHDVPLSTDGKNEDVKINCVDYLDGNLYVGTSASELLHFFRIPPDPTDPNSSETFILASRLPPVYSEAAGAPNGSRPGVQQILLLPRVGKACVLCNWTVTFYSLPELSPVFGATQVRNCNWIGGVDLNESVGDGRSNGVTILLSLNRRIQVVRIGEEDARVVRKIDFAGSTLSVRRDSIACVADSRSYSLLDVDRQLKIPLMSISSLDDSQQGGTFGQAQNISGGPDGGLSRSASSSTPRAPANPQGHSRSTSLGDFITGIRRNDRRTGEPDEPVFQDSDTPTPSRSPGPADKPLPTPPGDPIRTATPPVRTATPPVRTTSSPKPGSVLLKPHILSPTAEEFLLVTGTGPLDPGIGMFVNLDGDPTRPTLEFDRYPREIAVDGGPPDPSSSGPSLGGEEDGYVLASMTKDFGDGLHHGLEIQRIDVNVGENEPEKWWLEVKDGDSKAPTPSTPIGVRSLLQGEEMSFEDVVERLCQRRFSPFKGHPETPTMLLKSNDSRTALSLQQLSQEKALFDRDTESEDEQLPPGWEATRNQEGEDFVRRLAKTSSRLAVWAGSNIWWAIRNPLLLQLDSALELAASQNHETSPSNPETRRRLLSLLDTIKNREAKTELEFMTLGYVRQRASVTLLATFLSSPEPPFTDDETNAMEENLLGSDLDARVVLSMIPALRNEIVVNRRGIWIYGGIKTIVENYISIETDGLIIQGVSTLAPNILQFLRRFLTAWRKKKGFGSIPDEVEVFRTVDASLLLVLLELDRDTPVGHIGPVRKELYDLVDHGVDCFDRAVDLLESYRRLFVLSRLYQHRKMATYVLGTWRRIMEGEEDSGGELGDGEQRVRSYLSNISNQALVQEYGVWLASRNPKLGVQVFTDEKGKAPKFEHTQTIALLREEAPGAVKYYLEHLVFDKGNTAYVNELITYYLDIVITDLQTSPTSRETIAASYDAYRALQPPKPTYFRFLADNAPPNDEVWQSRLRLLQLLGGGHDYDAAAIRQRIGDGLLPQPPQRLQQQQQNGEHAITNGVHEIMGHETRQQLLVPEAIILAGRARQHEEALRLLVHRLGDYDTAVSYCLRGRVGGALTPAAGGAHHHRRDSESSLPPTWGEQTRLFRVLLGEFLALEDPDERVEQTGALLERFGAWFDVLDVLGLIPDDWEVGVAAGFLVAALRRLVCEGHEAMVARSLSGAENLRVGYEFVAKMEEKGPVVDAGGVKGSRIAGVTVRARVCMELGDSVGLCGWVLVASLGELISR